MSLCFSSGPDNQSLSAYICTHTFLISCVCCYVVLSFMCCCSVIIVQIGFVFMHAHTKSMHVRTAQKQIQAHDAAARGRTLWSRYQRTHASAGETGTILATRFAVSSLPETVFEPDICIRACVCNDVYANTSTNFTHSCSLDALSNNNCNVAHS